jgi:hypothetical protein
MIAALSGITSCGGTYTAAREKSAPAAVSDRFSQEKLNSLLRQDNIETQPSSKVNLWPHKVHHRRETLFTIALWYTGSGSNWTRLVQANPKIDPRRIQVGDTILIPEELLKTRRLMPAGFPKTKNKRPQIQKPQLKDIRPPAANQEATLFGPIENDIRPVEPGKNELPVPLEPLD